MAINVETKVTIDKDASGAFKRAQRKRLKDGAQYGLNHAVEKAPEDRGTLTTHLIDPQWSEGRIIWGFASAHARPQNFGTDPFWAPLDPLKEWAERVTGDPGFAYYVQWKIAQEGIEPKRFANEGRERQKQWYKSNPLSDYLEREL
jgi:hypothetical protein